MDLVGTGLIKPPGLVLYTPMSPAEKGNDSRDELLFGRARAAADPWDGAPSREARFIGLIKGKIPSD